MNIKKVNNCIDVRLPYEENKSWQQTFLFCSDIHFDNPNCDREKFFSHLRRARDLQAKVFIIGDFFCAMQGKYDPRRSKKSVRPEHNKDNYLQVIVEDSAEELKDYLDLIGMISYGNHETGVLNRVEYDLLKAFQKEAAIKGSDILIGNYQGYIRFFFTNSTRTLQKNTFWHHGIWGGVVNKGTQGSSRFGLIAPDAHLVVTGHTHDHWLMNIPRYILRKNGQITTGHQTHLKTGTYKQEFTSPLGWAIERIGVPKNIASWLIHFRCEGGDIEIIPEPLY